MSQCCGLLFKCCGLYNYSENEKREIEEKLKLEKLQKDQLRSSLYDKYILNEFQRNDFYYGEFKFYSSYNRQDYFQDYLPNNEWSGNYEICYRSEFIKKVTKLLGERNILFSISTRSYRDDIYYLTFTIHSK